MTSEIRQREVGGLAFVVADTESLIFAFDPCYKSSIKDEESPRSDRNSFLCSSMGLLFP